MGGFTASDNTYVCLPQAERDWFGVAAGFLDTTLLVVTFRYYGHYVRAPAYATKTRLGKTIGLCGFILWLGLGQTALGVPLPPLIKESGETRLAPPSGIMGVLMQWRNVRLCARNDHISPPIPCEYNDPQCGE